MRKLAASTKLKLAALAVLLLLSLLLSAYGGPKGPTSETPAPDNGRVELRLTDAPAANGLKLLLTVAEFQIKRNGNWHTLVKEPAQVDLLTLVGLERVMGVSDVPVGRYTRARFQISDPIIAHEGGQTNAGLKVERPEFAMEAVVREGKTTILLIDIDGEESFAFEGDKPVFDVQAKISVREG